MADITVHVPDDRVSEFYLMLGSWLAQGAGGPQDPREAPQDPRASALQDWADSDRDLDRARTVWRRFSSRAKDAVLVLMDYPGEAVTGRDLAPAAGIGDGAPGVAQALAQAAQQCTAAGRRTPWREQTIPSGGSTYWIETEAADLFRRLQPELNLLSAIDAFFGEDRPKPRRSAPPTGTR